MSLIIILFFILAFTVFYFATYPYDFKLKRKLKRVLDYPEVKRIPESTPCYDKFSEEEFSEELILEEIFLESKFVNEKMRVLILKPKIMKEIPLCLVLLHGIRDVSDDWINKARLRENYLTLRKEGKIGDIVFIIPDSGYDSESWYTNFYKDKNHMYEEFFSKDLTSYIEKEYPNSKKGIGGFSMGGYGSLKSGLKNLEIYDVVASFSGATSLVRMIVNRRVIRVFRYLYLPKVFFTKPDQIHFIKVFSPWGYKILKNDAYTIIKNTSSNKLDGKKFYLSVGIEDKKPYLMFQQWVDVVGRAKKYNLDFKGMIYDNEYHTWDFISKDIYNFLIFFTDVTKTGEK